MRSSAINGGKGRARRVRALHIASKNWLDLKRSCGNFDAPTGAAHDDNGDGINADVARDGATVPTATPILHFTQVSASRRISIEVRGRVGTARFNQHPACGCLVETLAGFDRIYLGGRTSATARTAGCV